MVASRIAIEQIISLRYCLCMLGVNLEPTSVLVSDNMAVVLNTTIPSLALKKKHQACNYHKVRESIAAGFIRYGHIKSEENVADLLTKPLSKAVFLRLCSKYRVYYQLRRFLFGKSHICTCKFSQFSNLVHHQ